MWGRPLHAQAVLLQQGLGHLDRLRLRLWAACSQYSTIHFVSCWVCLGRGPQLRQQGHPQKTGPGCHCGPRHSPRQPASRARTRGCSARLSGTVLCAARRPASCLHTFALDPSRLLLWRLGLPSILAPGPHKLLGLVLLLLDLGPLCVALFVKEPHAALHLGVCRSLLGCRGGWRAGSLQQHMQHWQAAEHSRGGRVPYASRFTGMTQAAPDVSSHPLPPRDTQLRCLVIAQAFTRVADTCRCVLRRAVPPACQGQPQCWGPHSVQCWSQEVG